MLMKILIRNLSRETTETELRAMFEAFGLVEACNLVMDKETGKSKGFGFAEMPKHMDAKTAIKRLNNQNVKGSVIRVKAADVPGASS
jgi:RNA recognition motif-containing protein